MQRPKPQFAAQKAAFLNNYFWLIINITNKVLNSLEVLQFCRIYGCEVKKKAEVST